MKNLDIQLDLDEFGHGQVLVNGEDLSARCKGISLFSDAGQPMYVTLTLWPSRLSVKAPALVTTEVAHLPTVAKADHDLAVNGRYPATGDGT